MLLAVDIGNTSVKFGTFENDELTSKFVIPTVREYTSKELREAVNGRLAGSFSYALISSVVPEVDKSFAEFIGGSFGIEPRFITTTDDFDLTFNFAVNEIGIDRLVNSFAASQKYGAPCIVIAFGTATTIDVVDRNREHLGGLIAPGPTANAKALQIVASKLPEVEIAEPPNVINTTTVSAIQSGIFYSQIGLVEEAIPHIRSEIGDDAKVVATGGFAHLIADKCRSVDLIDTDLTLEGLRMLYSRLFAA